MDYKTTKIHNENHIKQIAIDSTIFKTNDKRFLCAAVFSYTVSKENNYVMAKVLVKQIKSAITAFIHSHRLNTLFDFKNQYPFWVDDFFYNMLKYIKEASSSERISLDQTTVALMIFDEKTMRALCVGYNKGIIFVYKENILENEYHAWNSTTCDITLETKIVLCNSRNPNVPYYTAIKIEFAPAPSPN